MIGQRLVRVAGRLVRDREMRAELLELVAALGELLLDALSKNGEGGPPMAPAGESAPRPGAVPQPTHRGR